MREELDETKLSGASALFATPRLFRGLASIVSQWSAGPRMVDLEKKEKRKKENCSRLKKEYNYDKIKE